MAIYDFFLSRNNAASTPANYIGHVGRLFYDSANGVIKLSDGATPGGLSIPYTIASTSTVGGIKAGPGVAINSEGQLLIDSEGLEFTFGNLQGTVGTYPADYFEVERQDQDYAILSSINADEDIVFASNGTGAVRVVGDFSVRRANGTVAGALDEVPIFRVKSDGQVQMLVPAADAAEGAVTIVGGLDGVFQAPINTGVMLHITGIAGTPGVPSRIYNDAQNAFAAFVSRRYNNTAAAPTAVLANEEIMRLSGTAHNGTNIPGTANQRIVFKALGNQTLTNAGGNIELWTTPINTTTLAKVATIDSVGITLESGKIFTGNVTIGAGNTLNVTSATVTGLTLGGLNPADVAGTMTGSAITATVTSSSLTSVGTLTNLSVAGTVSASIGTFTTFTGKHYYGVHNAGTISAGGTLTVNFATDSVVYCVWGDGMTIAYSNYTAGSIVRILARKASGSGVDTFSLGGLTAAQVSSGSTTSPNVSADTTAFIELICTGTTIGSVYAKL